MALCQGLTRLGVDPRSTVDGVIVGVDVGVVDEYDGTVVTVMEVMEVMEVMDNVIFSNVEADVEMLGGILTLVVGTCW